MRTSVEVVEYLRGKEWSMGNGQCPECFGVPQQWHGHHCYPKADLIGHKKDCKLALSLEELGEKVVFLGDYHDDRIYESFWNERGLLDIRVKQQEELEG